MRKYLTILFLFPALALAAGETRIKGGIITPGSVSVGSSSAANSKAAIEVTSTTKGALLPRMSTTQRDAISSPPTGLEIYNTTTNKKNVYTGSAWTAVGAGGAGGVNFIGQTTAWASDNTDDRDLETSVGNWLAFADVAASTPVDLTGGSPNVTCTRGTSDPLDTGGYLLITKGAANRQGEGCSVVFNVQPAYQGTSATVTFPLSVVSGSLVGGDIRLFAYNVTKSAMIAMDGDYSVMGTNVVATFPLTSRDSTPVNHQYRLGVYFASTATTAVTLKADNISISPAQAVFGMAGSNKKSIACTGSWVSNTTYSCFERQVGDTIEFSGIVTTSGAPTSAALTVNLPAGRVIDTGKMPSASALVTPLDGVALAQDALAANYELQPYYSSTTAITFRKDDGDGTIDTTVTQASPFTFGAGDSVEFSVTVPIVGLDSGWAGANSTSFKISSYLANGTRVTGAAPTALGQYRSYLRDANATTFTETNGSPTASPSNADGIRIYNGNAFTSADTNNEPTRYEIFVGKNKNVRVDWYASAGRTGYVDTKHWTTASGNDVGYVESYDPTTGILLITALRFSGGGATHSSGVSGSSVVNDPYFEVTVSENALPVGISNPRSEVWVTGLAGFGSTNTRIARFTNVQPTTTGTAITYASSSTLGDSFTINEDGVYSFCSTVGGAASAAQAVGWTLNESGMGTTALTSVTRSMVLSIQFERAESAGAIIESCGTKLLPAGSVLRVHTNDNASDDTASPYARVTKVAN
jgi:hypothetical protein